MLDSNAVAADPALIVAKPSMPSLRPTPVRKRKRAGAKAQTTRPVSKAKQQQPTPVITPKSFEANPSTPLPRSNAVVVWQKRGPMGQMLHWLRLNGRDFVHLFTNPAPVQQPSAGVKLRTKKELLGELAVLREENAIMRQRLGLPQMPFGRQILSGI